MGHFTPVAIGDYKYVSNITDEYTRWTAVYLLTNKDQTPSVREAIISSTFPERLCTLA